MVDGIEPAAVLFGIRGFRVLASVEVEGEVWMLVETITDVVGCPECGVRAVSKGRRETEVRDLAVGGRPVRLRWRKRRWRCADPACPDGPWTEAHAGIRRRGVRAERARRGAFGEVGEEGRTVAEVAREVGVGGHTVMDAV